MANDLYSYQRTEYFLSPQDVVNELITWHGTAQYGTDEMSVKLESLHSHLSLDVVKHLKEKVDDEMLRNAQHAFDIAEICCAVADVLALPEAESLSLWAKGNALFFLNQYQEALEYFQHAEKICHNLGHDLKSLRLQINQLAALQEIGEYQTALDLAQHARRTCQTIGEHARRYLALLDMNIGVLYRRLGQMSQALISYEQAHVLFIDLGDTIQAARVDINRANVLEEIDRFDIAEQLLISAQTALTQTGYDQEVGRVDLNLGVLAYRRGQYQTALHHLENAHNTFVAIPNPNEVAVVNVYRALVYQDLNLLQETISLAAAAEITFREDVTLWHEALALMIQGVGYQRLQAYQKAEACLCKARNIFQQSAAHKRVFMLDLERAFLALEQGNYDKAQSLATNIEQNLDKALLPTLTARLHILFASCRLAAHDSQVEKPGGSKLALTIAHHRAKKALALADGYSLTEIAIATYHLLGKILEKMGNLYEARYHYQTALETIEQLRMRLPLDEFQIGFLDNKMQIYQDSIHLSHKMGAITELFYILNMAHTAPLPRPDLFETLPFTLSDTDRQLRNDLETLRQAWHWHQSKLDNPIDPRSDELPKFPEIDVTELRRHVQQIETQIAELTHRWQVRMTNVTTTDEVPISSFRFTSQTAQNFERRIQKRLFECGRETPTKSHVLLHYFVVDGHFQAILVTSDHTHFVPDLISVKAVQRLLKSWQFFIEHGHSKLLSQKSLGMAQTYLNRFYQALIAPLEDYLTDYDFMFLIVPPNEHNLPFAGFFDGQRYLIERFSLTYLSATEVLLTSQKMPVVHDKPHALIIGYSDEGRLPHTTIEGQAVEATLQSNWQTHLLLEQAATHKRFREACQTSHLLHLATHAIFRPDNPFFSWMSLADSRLTVADLREITLPKRPFVILSACQTGRGQPRGGGLLGMGRGFLAAGASGLIVSLWPVADQASAQLMTDFYQCVMPSEQSLNVAAALQHAQQTALQQGYHPFYWAGFIFVQG
ncbi:MAG: hypothetical protein B6242_08570 [Anaerolineaceae bacterium 4572_78]|nr:MAG: hypothetical protein B6242_08570 [Anaerolineaceae bacterium 4572_78]